MPHRTRELGFSAVEVIIATSIFAFVFGAIWNTLSEGTQHVAHAVERTNVEERARSCLLRITGALTNSGCEAGGVDHVLSHPRALDSDSTFVIFEERAGLDAWGTTSEYFLRSSPGETFGNAADDDGDGLIDERELAFVKDGITSVLSDDILEFRVTRAAGSDSIGLRLIVARPDPTSAEPVRAEILTRVALRNVPQL